MIQLKDISKTFTLGNDISQVLKGIDLEIKQGSSLSIVGPSGSGKSTLMNIIGLLDKPTQGVYTINGEALDDLTEEQLAKLRCEYFGFIYQSFNLIPNLSVYQNVELPLIYLGKLKKKDRMCLVFEALEKVGLIDKKNYKPNQLSGGQRQRVAIARAIINKPRIILADEPTGALDSRNGEKILSILVDLNSEGTTLILITHDLELTKSTKSTVLIKDGSIYKLDEGKRDDTNKLF